MSMRKAPTNVERAQALHRHLSDNESDCIKRNIIVNVTSINAAQSVAYCSVEQRKSGVFRRALPVAELLWRAEQALAPLIGLGIVPLLTVRHRSLSNTLILRRRESTRSPMDWIPDLLTWLGYPLSREGFSVVPVVHDPFGWRRAMHSSDRP